MTQSVIQDYKCAKLAQQRSLKETHKKTDKMNKQCVHAQTKLTLW